jgi:hypothetical protein
VFEIVTHVIGNGETLTDTSVVLTFTPPVFRTGTLAGNYTVNFAAAQATGPIAISGASIPLSGLLPSTSY